MDNVNVDSNLCISWSTLKFCDVGQLTRDSDLVSKFPLQSEAKFETTEGVLALVSHSEAV